MATAGLIGIKRRIKSVTNIRKITKAMGLVATAKLRKCRQKLYVNDKFMNVLNDTIIEVVKNYEGDNIYVKGNESNKKLFVIFTSESGLCGGFNGSVVSSTIGEIQKDESNSEVMIIGQKGKMYFNKYKYKPIAEFTKLPDLPELNDVLPICDKVLQLYNSGEFGEINLVYTKFVSAVKKSIEVEKLLPLNYEENYSYEKFIEFEPKADLLIEDVVKMYANHKILNSMVHSKTSEQSFRMAAMDSSTKNANDLLEELSLLYNRIRQSMITQEISEIVGGAEAQK